MLNVGIWLGVFLSVADRIDSRISQTVKLNVSTPTPLSSVMQLLDDAHRV